LYAQTTDFRMAPLFQDNMVLQQERNIPIWGKGTPGIDILIQTSWGKKVTAAVLSDGSWTAKIQTPKAGGPFQISIRHGKTVSVIRNILVGEVWLCSGQSNMEMPLEGWPPSDTIMNSANEIEQALYPSIRLFSVKRSIEASPSDMCDGRWSECSPLDVRSFSATAFYFGKMLHNKLNVPIGLINTSYGGTFIEAWMSKDGLKSFAEFADQLKKLEDCKDILVSLNLWITKHPSVDLRNKTPQEKWIGLKFDDEECSARNFNDSSWSEMKLPVQWEQTPAGDFDGVVWFRKQVIIPNAWIGKDLAIQLGPIDDMDETFINGQKVGSYLGDGYWKVDRIYKIPGTAVKDSVLQIAVRVIDTQGGGGIWGNGAKLMVFQDSPESGVSLVGNWKYLPVAEYFKELFYIYGAKGKEFNNRPKLPLSYSQNTPTSLFNAMVNPLVPFSIKGVIWYQGENNVYNPVQYKSLLPAMINDWRQKFDCGDFPFYFVQISPYDYGKDSKSQELREAQLQALSVKNTGMAVTLDIGNPKNIHPANKEDVGKRLALWALAKTYGKKVAYTGPLYKSMKIQKDKINILFDNAGAGLVINKLNGEHNVLIAGEDKVFKKAVIKLKGTTLTVSHPEIIKPAAVRYAWGNTDEATLFNKEGLPASSFRTDNWNE